MAPQKQYVTMLSKGLEYLVGHCKAVIRSIPTHQMVLAVLMRFIAQNNLQEALKV